ncbi:hypothetical protein PVAND_012008 [Polypedilum vanderplanki]|uniref:RPA-interacting protein C-terminal domain-containing protein n=1 Tax=Polypedilum vanderplanki TaxID=319348 RepID=A0A9J6CM39_POLVA|nr:hypothetical protein PVAND_012008 [Polypedilum vanderplanki]
MNVNASPTYHTSTEQKLKARNCALMLKNGSPKLRDILRENCRIRMKQSRQDAFSMSRNVTIERRQLINTIVKEELANKQIENDIELHENILKEILDNWDDWQNEEIEKQLRDLDPDNDTNQNIFCPVCQTNLLKLQENIISCNCGLRLYYPKSLHEFYEIILMNVKAHEERCFNKLTFFTEPKVGFKVLALNTLCTCCDYYASIVELL